MMEAFKFPVHNFKRVSKLLSESSCSACSSSAICGLSSLFCGRKTVSVDFDQLKHKKWVLLAANTADFIDIRIKVDNAFVQTPV